MNQVKTYSWHLTLFGMKFSEMNTCHCASNLLAILLLCLPLLFLFGLLPQCSTFSLCLLENLDMHLFGGTAMINIPGAIYSAMLSIGNFLLLSLIGYYGLTIDTAKVSDGQNFPSLRGNRRTSLSRIECKIFFSPFIVV